jgi:hypothetical protein
MHNEAMALERSRDHTYRLHGHLYSYISDNDGFRIDTLWSEMIFHKMAAAENIKMGVPTFQTLKQKKRVVFLNKLVLMLIIVVFIYCAFVKYTFQTVANKS